MKKLACSAGVFFGSANAFVRESAMLKPMRGGNESLAPTLRVTNSTLPNLPLS